MIHICRTPGRTEYNGRQENKWCFSCRKRSWHRLAMFIPKSEWYEPHVSWECRYCGRDFTLFPGQFYEEEA